MLVTLAISTLLYSAKPHFDIRDDIARNIASNFNKSSRCSVKQYNEVIKAVSDIAALNKFYKSLNKLQSMNDRLKALEVFKDFDFQDGITSKEALEAVNSWYKTNCPTLWNSELNKVAIKEML